uniref:Uncharacterized protein n=1 Tax=Arundo donax TaxID=35708 RepID=A0A0A8YVS4_ARUDO
MANHQSRSRLRKRLISINMEKKLEPKAKNDSRHVQHNSYFPIKLFFSLECIKVINSL